MRFLIALNVVLYLILNVLIWVAVAMGVKVELW